MAHVCLVRTGLDQNPDVRASDGANPIHAIAFFDSLEKSLLTVCVTIHILFMLRQILF